MADNARYTHVSPGVYASETELSYAVKSLGITTLGLVGETQKGPAFQPIAIENWRDFQNVFGGTSTEKFQGSQYPKYELPYIAKSYLSESNQLEVCRVLGLSGYNAGPAWVIRAKAENGNTDVDGMAIAVIRSRGHYEKWSGDIASNGCECSVKSYDVLRYYVGEDELAECDKPRSYNADALKLAPYVPSSSQGNICIENYISAGDEEIEGDEYFPSSANNYGKFKISGFTGTKENSGETFEYVVSLNPADNEYILKVLGTDPFNGDAPVFVESLYDVAFQQLVDESKVKGVYQAMEFYQPYHREDYTVLNEVADFITVPSASLTKKFVGQRYLANDLEAELKNIKVVKYDYRTNRPLSDLIFSGDTVTGEAVSSATQGQIYTVKQYTDETGKRHYLYSYYDVDTLSGLPASSEVKISAQDMLASDTKSTIVKVNNDGRYWRLVENGLSAVTCDMNNYKEQYRYASTPWFVSDVKGDAERLEVKRLFRFHTISDGNTSNNEIKVSIANVRPDEGTFDVYVRDINDTDAAIKTYETFTKCTLVPGDANYIAYKIGSFDGTYEVKSKYITVEVNETLATRNSVPAGFLGYPITQFGGVQIAGSAHTSVTAPIIKYNASVDDEIKVKRQYFGLSDITGVDIDMFTYKGVEAYTEGPDYVTQGFHLDSRLDQYNYDKEDSGITVTVDGEEGYKFDAVSVNNITSLKPDTPVIAPEKDMEDTIYSNVGLRKFTAYFYGGFDGWDAYRTSRTTGDEFNIRRYNGRINSTNGLGSAFDRIKDAEALGLNQQGITSDFYAYLAAARQFANPESIDVNVFATPGIDLINDKLLSEEVIEMIEEERADAIYVATLPDKPFGASDAVEDMYTPQDIVDELDATDIESNYTCTYYPWVKYQDQDNNQYILLPPTKDVVRNMAITDNTTYPWFAPAGITRGDVNCVRAHYITKLADEDTLYEGRINPVKTFASDGVKIWGQKNLQEGDAMLTRIAVRRLLLRMRKLVSIACNGLIFEPNDATTKNKFLSLVTPIMDNIKANRGISDYRIEVNDTVESRMRRELPAKLYFKPYNALEYVILDFIVTPESVNFDAI